MARKIEIEITGDTKNLERALSRSQKSAGNFEKGLKTASKGALVALGALGVGAIASVKSASDLEEQMNKTSVVFRGSEDAIHNWSKSTASSFGISQRAALEAAGTFGNMLVPMGLARDKAGEMSRKMVELAADMASFNNADPTEVLESLRSGLAGETEPLRKFGVFLNEARIKEEALRLGLMKQGGTLSAAAKAQATYAIILEDTTDAQGDFANTSDSLANQQRILKAELENTAAALGTALLPAATDAAGALLDLVNWTKENEGAAKALVGAIAVLSAGILVARASVAIYTSSTLAAIGATKGLRAAMATTPWGLAALAASGLVAYLISQKDSADEASDAQNQLAEAVRNYHRAIQEGSDARKGLEESNLRLESAEISVRRAMQARRDVDKDSTSTLLDRREADVRVSQALAERRDAEDAVAKAQNKGRTSMARGKQAADEMAAATNQLTEDYKATAKATRNMEGRTDKLGDKFVQTKIDAMGAGGGVDGYANKLRGMAAVTKRSNPQLSRTQELMADLSQAWQRVVDMPSAKAFVARFSVFTTVETNRVIPGGDRAAGGPVVAGQAYVVGEHRPEVFVPGESGRIVPRISDSPAGNGGGSSSGGGGLRFVVLANQEVVNMLRQLDGQERRRSGGRGIL